MSRPSAYGPSFQCRLTKEQHAIVERRHEETGAPYAEIVRRLVAHGLEEGYPNETPKYDNRRARGKGIKASGAVRG